MVDSRIRQIPVEVCFLDYKNFSYLVFDAVSGDAVMIDPAWQKLKLDSVINTHNVNLKAVLITHAHPDHLHLAERMSHKYKVPIYISAVDFPMSELDSRSDLSLIRNENDLTFGTINVTPIFTPGHTPGSICYRIGDFLFSGDTLFIEGCGMCFGKGGDPVQLFHSLQKLKSILPVNVQVYPGHHFHYDIGATIAFMLENNIYLQMDNIDHFVSFRMRQGQKGLFQFK